MFDILKEAIAKKDNEKWGNRFMLEMETGLPFTLSESADLSVSEVEDNDDDLDIDITDTTDDVTDEEVNAADREVDDAMGQVGLATGSNFNDEDLNQIVSIVTGNSTET